jgi:hypothetical protein
MQDCSGGGGSPSSSREPRGEYSSPAGIESSSIVASVSAGGVGTAHPMAELMSSVRRALDDGGCDQLASARVLNLLEQDAVGRDLENLRIMIELARSEKSLAATQQALAAKEAEAASLSAKAEELEQANAALVRRVHQLRSSGSSALQEQLQAALSQQQQLRADLEDKKVRPRAGARIWQLLTLAQEQCDGMVRVRNFLVDELSGANLQLQSVHAAHVQVLCVQHELAPPPRKSASSLPHAATAAHRPKCTSRSCTPA